MSIRPTTREMQRLHGAFCDEPPALAPTRNPRPRWLREMDRRHTRRAWMGGRLQAEAFCLLREIDLAYMGRQMPERVCRLVRSCTETLREMER
jgi:hypothetical protein